jgi:hypothetical protein
MSLIDPLHAAWLRRNWPFAGASAVFILFMVGHLVVFNPVAGRYRAAVKQASDLGISLERGDFEPLMPPRVLALISENSLSSDEATAQGGSGTLTSALLEDLTRLIAKHGMVVTATEPDAVVQLTNAVQVRAHLRVSCTYAQFVAFLDELSRSGKLIAIDRFTLAMGERRRNTLDLWVTQHVIKLDKKPI